MRNDDNEDTLASVKKRLTGKGLRDANGKTEKRDSGKKGDDQLEKKKKRKQATDTMKKEAGRGSVYQLATRRRKKTQKVLDS